MRGGDQRFSDEWRRFYDTAFLVAPTRHWLEEIEEQLGTYRAKWQEFGPFDFDGYEGLNVDRPVERLQIATYNIELLVRVLLCRSIYLIEAFIGSVNRDDYISAPLLLRGVMEQGALGFHACKVLRKGSEEFRTNRSSGGSLTNAQLSVLFGAKVNYGAILQEFQNRTSSEDDFDYAVQELEIVQGLAEREEFGEKSALPEDEGFRIASVAQMIDDAAAEWDQEGAPPRWLRSLWEYLSQYCHPSGFSWSFVQPEILEGQASITPDETRLHQERRMALSRFVRVAHEWVVPLPGKAYNRLHELSSELGREADALASKR